MRPADSIFFQRHSVRRSILQWGALSVASIVAALAWNWYAGRDLNWDSLNYHLYAALQWSEGRLHQDFMAASIQSYLNPLAYLPFYWMVRADWNGLAIASVLAATHAVNLVLVGSIASAIFPERIPGRFLWIVAAVLVAAINPVFATEVGSTFIDVTTSIPVLGGYALLFHWLAAGVHPYDLRWWQRERSVFVLAGLLLGAACGFKLTNAPFALALLPLVMARFADWRSSVLRTVLYGLGGLAGFLLIDGHWAWTLYREFGNPLFPFSNALFRSPDFAPVNFVDHRFLPESATDRLLFPLRALASESNIYTELVTPDLRFACLFLLLAIYPAARLFVRRRAAAMTAAPRGMTATAWWFIGTWMIGYALWLNLFGNGRYFMAGLLLLGPAIVMLLLAIGGAHRFMVYVLVLVLGWQVAFLMASTHRWTALPWTSTWYDFEIPAELRDQPHLFLSTRTLTHSFVAAYVHPQSAFANIAGQATIAENGPGAERVRALVRRHAGNVRSLFTVNFMELQTAQETGKGMDVLTKVFDGVYARFGLSTDMSSCVFIDNVALARRLADGKKVQSPFTTRLMSCRLVPVVQRTADDLAKLQRIDRVFDRIERACPGRLAPAGTVTVPMNHGWSRMYFNGSVTLYYLPANEKVQLLHLGGATSSLGRLEDWERTALPPHDCSPAAAQLGPAPAPQAATAGK